MPFSAWDEVAKNDLVLPIRGTDYRIPPMGYLDEIRIRRSQAEIEDRRKALAAGEELGPAEHSMGDEEFLTVVLSADVLARMRADNVPPAAIVHAAAVAHTDNVHGRAAAEYLWNSGLDPEALAAAMTAATQSPQTPTASTASTGTESDSETPSPASTSPTTSPRATRRKPPANQSTSTPSSPAPS